MSSDLEVILNQVERAARIPDSNIHPPSLLHTERRKKIFKQIKRQLLGWLGTEKLFDPTYIANVFCMLNIVTVPEDGKDIVDILAKEKAEILYSNFILEKYIRFEYAIDNAGRLVTKVSAYRK